MPARIRRMFQARAARRRARSSATAAGATRRRRRSAKGRFLAAGILVFAWTALALPYADAGQASNVVVAKSQKPYQLPNSPPYIEYRATATCTPACQQVDVAIQGYVDGALETTDSTTCYNTTSCSADASTLKAWGCHNYQGEAIASAFWQSGNDSDTGWSTIFSGCRRPPGG
jgi:hypothetical protein